MPLKRILCVEDDRENREMLSFLLRCHGYDVTAVSTIAEASDLEQDFDLYLLDVRLPDGSGIDLCRFIKSKYPTALIVLYSADAYESTHRQARAAGANAYVDKPEINNLLDVLRSALGENR